MKNKLLWLSAVLLLGCGHVSWPESKCKVEDVAGVKTHVCHCTVEADKFDGTKITRTCDGVPLPFVTYTQRATIEGPHE